MPDKLAIRPPAAPERPLIVGLKPARSTLPLVTVNAPVPRAVELPNCTVPLPPTTEPPGPRMLPNVAPATAPAPSIVPLGHGGVQLLWHNAVADLEVEVVRPNEVVAYFFDKGTGHEHETALTTDFSDITNFLWSNFRS